MPILKKGERFPIDSFELGKEYLTKIKVVLTWHSDSDLDASSFLLTDEGVISEEADFVFYNSNNRTEPFDYQKFGSKKNWRASTEPMSPDGAVVGPTDDPGSNDSGETIHVDLDKVRHEITEIVFCVTIYQKSPDETFKNVRDPRILIIDEESGDELCAYNLKENFSTETAVVVGALVNEAGKWEFEAVGKGYDGGLQTLVEMYN